MLSGQQLWDQLEEQLVSRRGSAGAAAVSRWGEEQLHRGSAGGTASIEGQREEQLH